jgi:hypothetical protein
MNRYTIEHNGQRFVVEAPDEAGAMKAIEAFRPQPPSSAPTPSAPAEPDARNNFMGKVDATVRGAADFLSAGMADEIAAGLGTGFGFLGDYSKELTRQRGIDKSDGENRFGYRLAGQVAGGIGGGVGLAKSGLSLGSNAINAGRGLPAVMGASAVDGAAIGALQGFGSGEGLDDRAVQAAQGAALGGVVGGAVPAVVAGAQTVGKPLVAPIMARLRPQEYANAAMSDAARRSGMTADDIANAIRGAKADGQGEFMVADALGNSGQRMMTTVTRTPNEMRQSISEQLLGRQMDQGRRVAGALGDASGSPLSASQLDEMLKAQRAADAAKNYAPVKVDTTAIDVSPAVGVANRAISPAADNLAQAAGAVPTDLAARAGIETAEASIRDPIRQALKDARSYLASDRLTVTNVEKAFRAKTNIDDMIADATAQGRGGLVAELKPMQEALDAALARTSKPYAAARDAYSQSSGVIDAIGKGRELAAPRNRTQDVLSTFGAMTPEQQQAARVGFFDPLITQAQQRAGTMSDSARPFTSNAMREQLPAIAAPREAARLERRLGRELTMSETARAALGGSKTADNLADAAEMSKFDPGVITNLVRGRPVDAIMAALSRVGSEAKGMPPRVVEQIGRVLAETNPEAARALLNQASTKGASNDRIRAAIVNALTASGSTAVARPTAP